MSANPVIAGAAQCLVHVPDLVVYGSKPQREIAKDPSVADRLAAALRPFAAAVRYPPNQAFVGGLDLDALAARPRPWFGEGAGVDDASAEGPFGGIVSQDLFYGVLERANVLTPPLVGLTPGAAADVSAALGAHPVLTRFAGVAGSDDVDAALNGGALPLRTGSTLRGCVRRDDRAEGREDENLDARTLLENLSAKASGAIALEWLLHRTGAPGASIDYIINCGEEAAGDRYQRGGGGLAKAIGEMCDCTNASGMDVKNFCAAPASALVAAGALVKAGVCRRVAVVAGGSLAKLGMKFQAFLDAGMPILDDCLGAVAFLVAADDGVSPILHLEPGAVGIARIGASTSDREVYGELITRPLEALGLGMADIERYAPELHNPEVMEHSGSGDVVHKNYRTIAAMAVLSGAIDKAEMEGFIERVGMVGFAPTQGHIPSAIPYIAHAAEAMRRGSLRRAMLLCKASLFLNRLTGLYDGVSFVLEANRNAGSNGRENA